MNKQSSLDYFLMKLVDMEIGKWFYANQLDDLRKAFNQSKAMHKEEIQDAWLNGMKGEMIAPLSMNNYKPEAEQYYNETF